MRVIAAWVVLLVAGGASIAMLISAWHHQLGAAGGVRRNAVELVWSLIPLLIVALCLTPSALGLASVLQSELRTSDAIAGFGHDRPSAPPDGGHRMF